MFTIIICQTFEVNEIAIERRAEFVRSVKTCQIRQVRNIILKYKLGVKSNG